MDRTSALCCCLEGQVLKLPMFTQLETQSHENNAMPTRTRLCSCTEFRTES